MTLQDSMTLIQEKRPEANPIPAFLDQLQEYETTCIDLGIYSSSKSEKSKVETKRRAPIGPAAMPKKQRVIGPAAMPLPRNEKEDKGVVCGPELPKDVVACGSNSNGDERNNDDRSIGVGSPLVVDKQNDEGGTDAMIGPNLPS